MEKKYFPIFIDLSEKKIVVIGGGVIATRRVKTLLEFAKDITIVAPEITPELEQAVKSGRIVWIQKEYVAKYRRYHATLQPDERLDGECLYPFKSAEADLDEMHVVSAPQTISAFARKSYPNDFVYEKADDCPFYCLKDADMVIAATNSPTVNHQVQQDCRLLEKSSGKSILVSVADDKNLCDFYFPSIVQKENVVVGINSGGESAKITKDIRRKVEGLLDAESVYEIVTQSDTHLAESDLEYRCCPLGSLGSGEP